MLKAFAFVLFLSLQLYILFASPELIVWISPLGGILLCLFLYQLLFIEKKSVTTFSKRTNGVTVVFHKTCNCTVTKIRTLSDLVNVYIVDDLMIGSSQTQQ